MNSKKRFSKLISGILTFLLIVSLAGVVSCDKKDEPVPPAPQPAKYTIKGVVNNQQSNTALSGVLVTMGALTQTTDASGVFEFKDLTVAGKYTINLTKEGFFDATYSLEFPEAAPNHTVTFNISITMVPFVPGVTPIDFSTGGTIDIEGGTPVTLTIPAGTTVKDKDNNTITGPINITAVETPDIVSGSNNNPGLSVLRFEPSGLQFSKPLPLTVKNPFSTFKFSNVQLEYYNETTKEWEVKSQSVTYNSTTKEYATTIDHFSMYKVAFVTTSTGMGFLTEALNVVDTPIENTTLVPVDVSKIKVERKNGYIFETPLETIIANAGVTGTDATKLKKVIEDAIKPYYGNSSSVTSFATVEQDISVSRTVQPNYKLVTTGSQAINKNKYSISISTDSGTAVIDVVVQSAGAVSLFFQDVSLDDHDHGSGGGGTL